MLIDAHCHIHEADYPLDADTVIKNAHDNGVDKMICIGTSVDNSRRAIDFASKHDEVFATIGVHPHYASDGLDGLKELLDQKNSKVVAVGEIGLDYHYDHSPRDVQQKVLKEQIKLALAHNLPIVFHVREAFDDFWPIFDSFKGIRGEIHGFSDSFDNMQKAVDRGLYIGVTGIATFTKDLDQQQMYKSIPLGNLILETDAPYLTPVPFRGKINEPAYVRDIAIFGGKSRHISEDEVASASVKNTQALFHL